MVVFYHFDLLVCPWISVEKIILTHIFFFFRFFRENSEIEAGCRGHMTTPFHKKIQTGFFHLVISGIYAMQVKKSMIKLLIFLQHGFQT
jgi:hypothetical protein